MEGMRTRHLGRITAAAAAGRRQPLAGWYRAALAEGIPAADLQEATLQVFLFAGFPRTLAAFEELKLGLDGAEPAPPQEGEGDVDHAARGREVFGRIYGRHAEAVAGKLHDLHPDFARFVLRGAYGRVLGRPFLSIQERELMAVAMLAALGPHRQLRAHVRGCLRVGVEPDEVRRVLAAAEEAVGELTAAREVVEDTVDTVSE
ncbi:MAG: carboxymuconolactone decarboxylase family protein [Planctomycetota bacterium]|jgi:alkylhydroperoxidase/carboxymuconolactone decarboxylase family protein YurZ